MQKAHVEDIYPLSPMQEGLLFHTLYDPDSPAYFVQIAYLFIGKWHRDLFEQSWHMLCQRHAILRSAFIHEDVGRPLQVVLKDRQPEISFTDLSHLSEAEQRAHIETYQQQNQARGFDLQRDVLMRIGVFRLREDQHVFVWSYAHILMDGWCLGLLEAEFRQIYTSLTEGNRPQLPPVLPYRDYIRWLDKQDRDAAQAYWVRYLAGYEQLATLPKLVKPWPPLGYASQELTFELDERMTWELRNLATHQGVTLSTVIRCIWGLILGRYNGVDDVVFGAIVSGRPSELPGVEQIVGLFINAIPVRIRLQPDQTFAELLKAAQVSFLEGDPHQYLPLAEVQMQNMPGRVLFDHLFTFENYPADRPAPALSLTDRMEANALSSSAFAIHSIGSSDSTHYDFNLIVLPVHTLHFRFSYNSHVYSRDQLERTAEHLRTAIRDVVRNPHKKVNAVQILPDSERDRVLVKFNSFSLGSTGAPPHRSTRASLPHGSPVAGFEAQVEKTPDDVAVVFGETQLNYRALNARINQVAHFLKEEYRIQPDDRVGILLDRSEWAVIALWGVLKAGGAYVPIDPAYPAQRMTHILQDSGSRLVLTEEKYFQSGVANTATSFVDVRQLSSDNVSNPLATAGAHHLAYVIYTSGSTGLPKGCQLELRNLDHYLQWASGYYFDGAAGGTFGLFSSLAFDLTVTSLFLPLLRGRTLHIFPQNLELTDILRESFDPRNAIDSIKLTPSHISLLKYLDLPATNIRLAIVGGEALAMDQVRILRGLNPEMAIYNEYGPTETTVGCIVKRMEPDDDRVLIGQPIANTQAFLMNRGQSVPIGVNGEICIGGAGVGRGYLKRDDLNAEAFIDNPFVPNERLYRTGDLGRWLPDGNIELFGRNDDQVKIRGHRIETGEIEHQLLQHEAIQEAVVIARGFPNNPDLVAYVTSPAAASQLNVDVLQNHLKRTLPVYMLPAHIVQLERLPLSPNGKVDKKALPDPADAGVMRSTKYVAPRNEIERQLAQIWREVLQIEQAGITDNFFEIGGHSLKAIQVLSRIHKHLDVKIGVRELFDAPTIVDLVALIQKHVPEPFAGIEPALPQAYYELSHAQKRLWLEHQIQGAVAYNMPSALLIEEALDISALKRAFATVIQRHEALRTAFVVVDGDPKQKIYPELPFTVTEIDLSYEVDAEAQAKAMADQEANTPFDLTQPPLMRATIIKLNAARHVFLLTIHHIIGDGWSGQVLSKEILTLYEAYRQGKPNPLAPLCIQYKDFTVWQNARGFESEERYWLDRLAGVPDYLRLPYDCAAEAEHGFHGGTETIVLSGADMEGLRALARKHRTILSNVVLALFILFLQRLTRQDDICVGMASANRNHPDLENLLGFFVNILPIRVQLSADLDFSDLLSQVMQATSEALEHQDYPFDLLIQKLNPQRRGNRQPILNVIYGFQSYADVNISLETLASLSPGLAQHAVGAGQHSDFAQVRAFDFSFETAKFDLTLFVLDEADQLHLTLEYDSNLFTVQTIRRYLSTMARFAEMLSE